MVQSTHPEGNEGYTAMKKSLRKNPRMLYTMLNSRREDLERAFHDAAAKEDLEHVNALTASIEQIDDALERLESRFVDAESDHEEKESVETTTATPTSKPKSIGFGFSKPEPEDLTDEERAENPVAMNSRIRREMGMGAANFLDDYAKAIHTKALEFFTDIKTKALDLRKDMEMGKEDPDDGEVSLRETLLVEVGRRGLADIEPVFNDWRASVMKQIAKEIKELFEPATTTVELKDDQIGSLLGLDDLDEELAAEESDNAKADSDAPEASEEPSNDESEPSSKEHDQDEAVDASIDAPISIAKGPVSMTVSAVATDFVPSGFNNPVLE